MHEPTQFLRDQVRAYGIHQFLVSVAEASNMLGIQPSALHMRQHRGGMPSPAIKTRSCVFYWRDDIEALCVASS